MGAQRKTTGNGFAEFLREPDDLIRALNRILDALLFTSAMQGKNNCDCRDSIVRIFYQKREVEE